MLFWHLLVCLRTVFVAKWSEQLVMLENVIGRVLKLRFVQSFYSITMYSPEG